MDLLEKADLKYEYTWTVLPADDPRITGIPNTTLLNIHEGYEVLAFINNHAKINDWKHKVAGLKVERLIRENLPSNVRSHEQVWNWVIMNWARYQP